MYQIGKLDAQVVTGNLVHLDLPLIDGTLFTSKTDQDGVPPLLSPIGTCELTSNAYI